jgi:hypothetical protein
MFYYPHMIVALIKRDARPKSIYEGLCENDFIKCRIPCSWDTKRQWIGPREKRVEIEGTLSVKLNKTTERYIAVVGNAVILRHIPSVIWVIEQVNHNDGVFISDGTFDLLLSRHGVEVPPTGDLRKYLDEF